MTTSAAARKKASDSISLTTVKGLLTEYGGNATAIELDRLTALEAMIDMAMDQDWGLPTESCCEIRDTAVASYVSIRWQQNVPASIAALAGELRNELQAYGDFCDFRDSRRCQGLLPATITRVAWLESKRQDLSRPRHSLVDGFRSFYRRVRRTAGSVAFRNAFDRQLVNDPLADKALPGIQAA